MHKLLLLCLVAASVSADGVNSACGDAITGVVTDAKQVAGALQAAAGACKSGATPQCLTAVGAANTALVGLSDDAVGAVGQCGVSGACYSNVKVVADTIKTANAQIDAATGLCDKKNAKYNEAACVETVLAAAASVVKATLYGYNAVKVCKGGDPHSCLSDVLELVGDTQDTVQQIVTSVKDCKSKNSACAAEAAQAASALAATVSFGLSTAEKCSLIVVNACVNDIDDAMHRLGAAGSALESSAKLCAAGGIPSLSCVKQLVQVGMDVVSIGIDVVKATTDCGIPIPHVAASDPLDDCEKAVFATATDGLSTVSSIAQGIKQCSHGAGAACAAAATKSVSAVGALDQDISSLLSACRLAKPACTADIAQAGKAISAAAAVLPTLNTNCTAKNDEAAAEACVGDLLKVSGDASWAVAEFVVATGDCGKSTELTVCLKGVLGTIEQVQGAARAVATAIDSCKAKSSSCVADVAAAVDAATAALEAGVATGETCHAFPVSACVDDVTAAVGAVKDIADDLRSAQGSCKTGLSGIVPCVQDLFRAVQGVVATATHTAQAFSDCHL